MPLRVCRRLFFDASFRVEMALQVCSTCAFGHLSVSMYSYECFALFRYAEHSGTFTPFTPFTPIRNFPLTTISNLQLTPVAPGGKTCRG
mmetsp:Transcript_2620/g.4207  ORF Transcript_2620/g.4207 Transcript_2620/m.4207 type:complete len:89 (-) Transcript_2620:119-385(-)